MKRALVVLGFVVVGMALMGTAEASIGQSLGNGWRFLTAPVNCVGNLAADAVTISVKFVACLLNNLNPSNLIP